MCDILNRDFHLCLKNRLENIKFYVKNIYDLLLVFNWFFTATLILMVRERYNKFLHLL